MNYKIRVRVMQLFSFLKEMLATLAIKIQQLLV